MARDVTDRRGASAELDALRRVATLVAQRVQPEEVFAVVAEEIARLVAIPLVRVMRYESDDTATQCAAFSADGSEFPFGARSSLEGASVLRLVRDTSQAARIDDYSELEGEIAEIARRSGIRSAVGAPIVLGGRLWGAIVASGKEELPEGTEARLADFTELVVTAIENAQSREALERLADEQAALRRVATLVAQGVRADEIFAAVSDEVGRLVGTDSATVMRFEDDGSGVVFVGVTSKMSSAFPLGAHWEFEDGMASAEVYRTGRSARGGARDWSTVDGPVGETHHRLGIVSTVASPIVVEGRRWGAMAVQSQEPLPPDTEGRLETFTELLATAIANAESRGVLTRLAEEQAALRRVATLVARGVRPDELFAAVSDEVGRLVGTDSAAIIKYDDDGEGIVFVGVTTKISGAFPLGAHWEFQEGMASAEVYRTGRSARSGAHLSTVEGPVGETHRSLGIISAVASPIVVEGRLWGAMAVHGQEPLPRGTEERLEKFTELVATAIANAESRTGLTRLAEEQATLRRVATLVAQGVRPDEIFAAVSNEVGRLFGTDSATVVKYDDKGAGIVFVGVASRVSGAFPLGAHWLFQEGMASAEVYRTGRSARTGAHLSTVEGPIGDIQRQLGIMSSVASPIVVEGRLWGAVAVQSQGDLPPDTEQRLEEFTELVATAIANAESRAELTASRARIVAASDEARRRIERDLHDGAQQRLVSLGLELRMAESTLPPELDEPRRTIARIEGALHQVVDDLREISRGVHPAVLSEGGLGPAMRALARRSAIPVELRAVVDQRLPEPIEVAAYFVASEGLTNAAKHAKASSIELSLATSNGSLLLSIRDDGVGGADPTRGSGLVGLTDRVEALGGKIDIETAPGAGTSLVVTLPFDAGPMQV